MVLDVDAHFDGSCLLLEHGVDEGHAADEDLARIRLRLDQDLLPVAQPHQVGLVGVELDPDVLEVGQRVDLGPGLDVVPLLDPLLGDDTAHGRGDHDVVVARSASFDLRDLLVVQAPQPELLARRLERPDVALTQELAPLARARVDPLLRFQ